MASVMSRRAARALQARLASTKAQPKPGSSVLQPQAPKVTKLPNGLTVASIENFSPISRVAVIANAGSRFEDSDNLGITHCLRVCSGLTNQKSSGFKITRTIEQAGGDFTCSSTREYMYYKVDCLRGNIKLMTETLMAATTTPAFKPWEVADAQKYMKLDRALLKSQPDIVVYDLLHQAAFRNTLGRSLYAPDFMLGKYSTDQLLHYMKTYYSSGRMALVGVGVDHDELVHAGKLVAPFAGASISTDKAKYYGGEIRQDTGGDLAYAAVAVEGPSTGSFGKPGRLAGKDLLHSAVLQNVMGMGPCIKYSQGAATSRLTQAVTKATNAPFAVSCINANYTDSGLFGFYAVAQPQDIEKVLRSAFNEFAVITKNGVDEKEVARAKQQLKAQICMYQEGSEAVLYDLGEQALGSEELLTMDDVCKFVDNINTSDVANIAKKLVNQKATMAATGNLSRTPYIDQILH